jgi:hypothetical protein
LPRLSRPHNVHPRHAANDLQHRAGPPPSSAVPKERDTTPGASVLLFVMALLASRGCDTPSLRAQSGQRRSRFLNISRDIPGQVYGL